jgi:hypothetical protein
MKLVLIKSEWVDFVSISFIVFQSRFKLEYKIRDFVLSKQQSIGHLHKTKKMKIKQSFMLNVEL